jgi:hypothetical protein
LINQIEQYCPAARNEIDSGLQLPPVSWSKKTGVLNSSDTMIEREQSTSDRQDIVVDYNTFATPAARVHLRGSSRSRPIEHARLEIGFASTRFLP